MTFKELCEGIISDDALHAKWLNTLSLMESIGARKIIAHQNILRTDFNILRHMAEEVRHAYILKKQIQKLNISMLNDYQFQCLLAPIQTYHYLTALEVMASRWIKDELRQRGEELKRSAYVLVTYIIECRAMEVYPVYQSVLDTHGSKVNVQTIIREEETHLADMKRSLAKSFPDCDGAIQHMLALENKWFLNWVQGISKALQRHSLLS